MTHNEQISTLRIMLGTPAYPTDTDDVLSAYLSIAGDKIMDRAYPFTRDENTDVPVRYHLLQCEIACYLMNKRGAEGQISMTENGISRLYEDADVPKSMLKQVIPLGSVF